MEVVWGLDEDIQHTSGQGDFWGEIGPQRVLAKLKMQLITVRYRHRRGNCQSTLSALGVDGNLHRGGGGGGL